MEDGASADDEEHVRSMRPQDIIEEINRQFDNAIIATDVGQHQMFTTQYIEITNDKQLVIRRTWNNGIRVSGGNRCKHW